MTEPLMPALSGGEKRIVFLHDDGIAQIWGVASGPLPETLVPMELRGVDIPFSSLVRVDNRAAYYKAPCSPSQANERFHKDQR